MLFEEFLIDADAPFDIIHPLPGSFVERVLSILLGVVVFGLAVRPPQLPVLSLHHFQIALEVVGEVKVLSPVVWLRIESWEEKETGTGPVMGRRS